MSEDIAGPHSTRRWPRPSALEPGLGAGEETVGASDVIPKTPARTGSTLASGLFSHGAADRAIVRFGSSRRRVPRRLASCWLARHAHSEEVIVRGPISVRPTSATHFSKTSYVIPGGDRGQRMGSPARANDRDLARDGLLSAHPATAPERGGEQCGSRRARGTPLMTRRSSPSPHWLGIPLTSSVALRRRAGKQFSRHPLSSDVVIQGLERPEPGSRTEAHSAAPARTVRPVVSRGA